MKVIILAGGFGTRLSEYTEILPKPMVPIGERPIIWHIMQHYAAHGFNDFVVALGYKAQFIKEYFLNYRALNSDFSIHLGSGVVKGSDADGLDWNVSLVNTGLNTMTAGRVKRLREHIGNNRFMLTYGDGVCDVNIKELVRFHESHGKLATVTAVRPNTRFGELEILDEDVLQFQEKPQLDGGWINGGFFVFEPGVFDLIDGDEVMLERDPLEKVSNMGQLKAYKHYGFWQCMDTKKDRDNLEKIYQEGAPWIAEHGK